MVQFTHAPMIKSVLSRLLITFLSVLIPMYAIGIIIYNWGMNTLRDSIAGTMQAKEIYYMDTVERDIQRIQALQYDLVTDSNLNKLVNTLPIMNQYNKALAIRQLGDRLATISSSSPLIHMIKVHLPELRRSIYSSGYVNELEKQEYDHLVDLRMKTNRNILLKEGTLHLVLAGNFEDSRDRPYNAYIIDIELKSREFQKSIDSLKSCQSEGGALIEARTRKYIATVGEEKVTTAMMETWAKGEILKNYDVRRVRMGKDFYLSVRCESPYLDLVLVKYVLEREIFQSVQKYHAWFWVLTIAMVAVIVLYSVFTVKFIGRPVECLVYYFKKVAGGDFKTKINFPFHDEFGELYQNFNHMVKKLDEMIHQVYEQKILVQKAELKQLQFQINPHFLYNSFFIFHRTILSGDMEQAAELSQKLGSYFKYITRNAVEYVPLASEVEHARIYAEIQALRFEDQIQIEFEALPSRYEHLLVPRLILQPILENCFQHGLRFTGKEGLIRVSNMEVDKGIRFIIEDNGRIQESGIIETLREKMEDNGTMGETSGLVNIHRRIQLMFGRESGISIEAGELGGIKVVLTLMLKSNDKGDLNVSIADCG